MVNYWLLKTEPDEFSFEDLLACGQKGEPWTGIRNYQARNYIRDEISPGDEVLIYHSSCKKIGVVGVGTVISEAFVDPLQFDPSSSYFDVNSHHENPRWLAFRVRADVTLPNPIPLGQLKQMSEFEDSPLVKKGVRLSIIPITQAQWYRIIDSCRSI